jgi:CBS domain-containing protein
LHDRRGQGQNRDFEIRSLLLTPVSIQRGDILKAETVKFSSLFTPQQVICHLEALSCEQLIRRLIERLGAANGSLNAAEIFQLILKRESCGIAHVLPDVAVIHVRVKGLDKLHIALATSRSGLCCSVAQGQNTCTAEELSSVRLVVLMLAPLDDPAGYLRGISALTQSCRREGFVNELLSFDEPEKVWSLFDATDYHLPAYVTARDIMRTEFAYLRDTETLSSAIDMFCKLGISEVPVVDADGDLSGIVTEDELIRVCLPEYITWMEDLSPILNFEPFAEILRQESNLPLLEIMLFAERYATVDEESPAIQVAKVMMRRDVRQVYVVRKKRLVGVITIQDFIHKVLRA